MHLVQIPDDIKHILDDVVADGVAASEAEVLSLVVRRYAIEQDDETAAVIAAAEAGIADIEAGRFTTIASQADLNALRQRIRTRASALAREMRTADLPAD